MKFNFLSKKVVFYLILVLILLLIAGVFLWKEIYEKEEVVYERIFVDSLEYEIKDVSGKKILENEKEGLIVDVPDGWLIKKYDEEIGFFSPEIEFDKYGGFLKSVREKGACVIGVEIFKDKEEIIYIESLIRETKENPVETDKEILKVVIVGNKLALKRVSLKNGKEIYVSIKIPIDDTVYSFSNGIIFSEKCIDEFDKFLETVSINK